MECDEALEWMAQVLDGGLELTEAGAMRDHLSRCEGCHAEWERLQRLERLLRGTPAACAPTGFAGRVMARLDRRRRLRRTVLGGLSLAAGAAVALFLMLAPAFWTLPSLGGELLALSRAADVFVPLADAAITLLDSLRISAGALALPALPLTLCGLTLALVANLVWLSLVRRLRPAVTLA